MARVRLRRRREVIARCEALRRLLRTGLDQLPAGAGDPAVLEAVWQGEGLGVLLWSLSLAELAPYDRPFDYESLLRTAAGDAQLRPAEEIDAARETARLWHWRARTDEIERRPEAVLPPRWQSFDQLVAATAMRGHERGLLPRPLRGDFPAFGTVYRQLTDEQHAEALSIAWERHRALNWLCGLGGNWHDVPMDT
jgi:hypothetical protein